MVTKGILACMKNTLDNSPLSMMLALGLGYRIFITFLYPSVININFLNKYRICWENNESS